jgi:hypothetical protein
MAEVFPLISNILLDNEVKLQQQNFEADVVPTMNPVFLRCFPIVPRRTRSSLGSIAPPSVSPLHLWVTVGGNGRCTGMKDATSAAWWDRSAHLTCCWREKYHLAPVVGCETCREIERVLSADARPHKRWGGGPQWTKEWGLIGMEVAITSSAVKH